MCNKCGSYFTWNKDIDFAEPHEIETLEECEYCNYELKKENGFEWQEPIH